ncbi:hypothetical protein N7535_005326 [Penicillium sp. DV-2018c]|nr:hypothetical protein N7461_008907 [Penicillium sp. DV-2018c]KAJ5571666.1 hypothetical protein N7535_005326 [Penicillium sp. DV-2018c]
MVSTTNTGHDDARQPPPSTKGSSAQKPAKENIASSAEAEQAQEQDAVADVADELKAAAESGSLMQSVRCYFAMHPSQTSHPSTAPLKAYWNHGTGNPVRQLRMR